MNNRIENIIFIPALILLFCTCSQKKTNNETPSLEGEILNYLSVNYKIDPDVSRLEKQFKDDKTKVDSIMFSNLKVIEYKPLNLRFINYQTNYPYTKREESDAFEVNLIQNLSNSQYFHDRTTRLDGGRYCGGNGFVSNNIEIGPLIKRMLTKTELQNYTAVTVPKRWLRMSELTDVANTYGIAQYLNQEYRFKEIEEKPLYSLFQFYDSLLHGNIYKSVDCPMGLFKYYSKTFEQKVELGDFNSAQDSIFLKEKIQDLIHKKIFWNNFNYVDGTPIKCYLWVYEFDRQLLVREITRLGSMKMGYTYNIKEDYLSF